MHFFLPGRVRGAHGLEDAMTTQRARKKEARRLAAAENIPYSAALARLEPATTLYVLQPTAEEAADGITVDKLGVRALGPDATPGQRAAAEAHWRPIFDPDQPCRCSGGCHHGQQCTREWDEMTGPDTGHTVRCPGRIVHVDRYPGSLWGVHEWYDEYACSNAQVCGGDYDSSVTLPNVPWGEQREGGGTLLYDRIRHPNFLDFDSDTPERPQGDGVCRVCGGYALDGLLCDGDRAEGYDDSYGMISEPDPEPDWDDEYDEREIG